MSAQAQEEHATLAGVTRNAADASGSITDGATAAACGGGGAGGGARMNEEAEQPQAELLPVTTPSASALANVSGAEGVECGAQKACSADADDVLLTDALLFSLEEDEELLMLEGLGGAIDLSDLNFSDDIGGFPGDASQGQQSEWLINATMGEKSHSPSMAQAIRPKPVVMKSDPTPSEPRPPSCVKKPRVVKPDGPVFPRPTCAFSTPVGEKRTTGRKRAKDELEYLRQHVNDLEEQLQQLHPNPHGQESSEMLYDGENNNPSALLSLIPESSSSSSSSSGSTLWKRVASRQMDERRKAETENTRLRDLLEAQLRLARSLARMLRKRPNLTV